ncbi:MAG: SH3 domain-containing protein [Cyanobacteria bacterium P01_A01_bin.37]
MLVHRLSLIALLTALTSAVAMPSPAWASEIRIRFGSSHHSHGHRLHHHQHHIPSIRYIYPDGRVIRQYGYPASHREVLILPSPGIIQQPVSQPFRGQSFITPSVIVPQSTHVVRQTRQPRLLHGRHIQSIPALVLGVGGISGREGPGTVYTELTQFVAGQTVVVTQIAGGGDGFDWFLTSSPAGQHAWIRGDRLSFFDQSR